jgi:hypothetical protein
MKRYRTAEDKNHRPLPIVGMDFAAGARVAFTAAAASSVTPGAGAAAISVTKDAYVSIGGTASDAAGSLYLAAGSLIFIEIGDGQSVSVRGAAESGALFIVPVAD